MDIQTAMRQAYSALETLTPLPVDCGEICGKRCCKGKEGDGMYLFPGETLMPAPFVVSECDIFEYPVSFVECPGFCQRETRPLSCRIFPFAPYLDEDGTLRIIPDPRAKYKCPLLLEEAKQLIDKRFLATLNNVFAELLMFEDIRLMLQAYSQMLDFYKQFTG